MKIKVSEATPLQLDWLVARCEDAQWDGEGEPAAYQLAYPEYSTNWSHGGPIIEREHITLKSPTNQLTMNWEASIGMNQHLQWAHNPLIAAMRCYIASKLGDEVELYGWQA